jgi:hypothetical protein
MAHVNLGVVKRQAQQLIAERLMTSMRVDVVHSRSQAINVNI